MSSSAAWANTAIATLWPLVNPPDWSGAAAFGSPEPFECDYKGQTKLATNSAGREFVSRMQIYTERADIKEGDRVLIGWTTDPDPVAAGAFEVKAVTRYGDTFERVADDFVVMT
jgi:hypothetical protein